MSPQGRTSGGGAPRGFTLVELLVSIAIIMMVAQIVIVKYGTFDSVTLLKSTAYDMGLAIREAQVKSVSYVGAGEFGDETKPYGVSFDLSDGKSYTVFHDKDGGSNIESQFDVGEEISTIEIPRSMYVDQICTVVNGNTCDDYLTRLDISFKRPEYKAIFYAEDSSGEYMNSINNVKIILASTKSNVAQFAVKVSKFGQISIEAIPAP